MSANEPEVANKWQPEWNPALYNRRTCVKYLAQKLAALAACHSVNQICPHCEVLIRMLQHIGVCMLCRGMTLIDSVAKPVRVLSP